MKLLGSYLIATYKVDIQCSRAREPTFKNLHWELPEFEKSVKYISLTVLSEKEVI